MERIAAQIDWKLTQTELDHIGSAMDSMRSAGFACQQNNTCDIHIPGNGLVSGPSDDARTALYDLTSADMLWFLRTKTADLQGPWNDPYWCPNRPWACPYIPFPLSLIH